jgi:hypothetical protein
VLDLSPIKRPLYGTISRVLRKLSLSTVVSYNEPKEMTVSDVEKALGHKVKIVK